MNGTSGRPSPARRDAWSTRARILDWCWLRIESGLIPGIGFILAVAAF
ncbi:MULTISPECIES: hypothetical protein [Massilia]|jgi:hypothetical protein|nr:MULTISPECIES: hypothetical protein [Massilia]QYG01500.1 hypothetical protein KY496_24835 [Massilia sp. NP310]